MDSPAGTSTTLPLRMTCALRGASFSKASSSRLARCSAKSSPQPPRPPVNITTTTIFNIQDDGGDDSGRGQNVYAVGARLTRRVHMRHTSGSGVMDTDTEQPVGGCPLMVSSKTRPMM